MKDKIITSQTLSESASNTLKKRGFSLKKKREVVQEQQEQTTNFNTPPITGGNTYTTKLEIETKDEIIKSWAGTSLQRASNNISKALGADTQKNSYNYLFLLNFIADYFSNLVRFKFEDEAINRAVSIAIRLGVIYGKSAFWKVGDKYAGMYLNRLELDLMGYPSSVNMMLGQKVLMTTEELEDPQGLGIDKTVDENLLVFLPYNHRVGGMVTWRPFLLTLERLLKMVYTNSYQYLRSFTYKVYDSETMLDELKLFADINNPFIITYGGNEDISNKFGSIDLQKNGTGLELMEFIKEFQKVFYELIGRGMNTDKKSERNIAGEVEASQSCFEILQNELKTNVEFFLESVKKLTGCNYEILEDKEEENEVQRNTEQSGTGLNESNEL